MSESEQNQEHEIQTESKKALKSVKEVVGDVKDITEDTKTTVETIGDIYGIIKTPFFVGSGVIGVGSDFLKPVIGQLPFVIAAVFLVVGMIKFKGGKKNTRMVWLAMGWAMASIVFGLVFTATPEQGIIGENVIAVGDLQVEVLEDVRENDTQTKKIRTKQEIKKIEREIEQAEDQDQNQAQFIPPEDLYFEFEPGDIFNSRDEYLERLRQEELEREQKLLDFENIIQKKVDSRVQGRFEQREQEQRELERRQEFDEMQNLKQKNY
ncbi:hypothetical protein CL632_00175 [bacterium]|jgi:hypothetical protein|nr:hypothetical protein [bacterium]MDP6571415.1 hypothetical protein [Patescibacteria group bacterium]|tara:strand:- start:17234 stop:18031 length:798 start_codon:yes stop_codon:yes gene_type:complete